MELANKVKVLIKENGITNYQLEQELGFSNGSIGRWNESQPSIDKVVKVAEYFGITVDELLGIKPKKCFTFSWEAISEKSIDIFAPSKEEALNIWIEGLYNHNEIKTNDEDMDPNSLTLNDEYVEVG